MIDFLFLLQYSFLNGFLVFLFFFKDKKSGVLEILSNSILLSLSLNSLCLYLLISLFDLNITRFNTLLISFSLSAFIILLAGIKRILKKTKLSFKELKKWDRIIKKMNIIISEDKIISQFKGYFKLKELNWTKYRKKYKKIARLDRILKAEGKSPDHYKVAKQADVLMIFYLLSANEVRKIFTGCGYNIDKSLVKKNYDYYIKRTSHGSTLSKVVHCYLSQLVGRQREFWSWFQEVLKSDIYDTQGGTTPEGIHAGVMGGSIDIVIRSFAGINISDNELSINPKLPKKWKSLKLKLLYRNIFHEIG